MALFHWRSIRWTLLLAALACHAVAEDTNDQQWPRAWFEPLKTASELNITEFSQSPVLDSQDLPPVEQRLLLINAKILN